MTPGQSNRATLSLRRIIIAQCTFLEAMDAVVHLQSLPSDHPAYSVIFCGIATTYMRPFLRGDGLGPLPNKFESFGLASTLQGTHDYLKRSRHKFAAHYEEKAASELFQDERAKEQLLVRVRIANGQLESSPPIITGNPDTLPSVQNLLLFQMERLRSEADGLFRELVKTGHYPDGLYVLGETFPRS